MLQLLYTSLFIMSFAFENLHILKRQEGDKIINHINYIASVQNLEFIEKMCPFNLIHVESYKSFTTKKNSDIEE